MALARLLANKGNQVTVWSALEEELENLSKTGKHPNLPKMEIPKTIEFQSSLEEAIKEKIGKEELSGDDVNDAVRDVVGRVNRLLPNYKTIRRVLIRRDRLERGGTQKVKRKKDAEQDDAADATQAEE